MYRNESRWRDDAGKEERAALIAYLQTPEACNIKGSLSELLPAQIFRPDGTTRAPRANTDRAYLSDKLEYIAICVSNNVAPLAWTEESWAHYLKTVAERTNVKGEARRYTSLERKAYAVGDFFLRAGLPSPTRTLYHKSLMREYALNETRSPQSAKPLYGEDVHTLVESYDTNTPRGLMGCSLAVTDVTRGWRASTTVGIQLENVSHEVGGVIIKVCDQKTSKTMEPETTATRHTTTHRTCMPCILKKLVDFYHELGIVRGPLFRPIDRWGHIGDHALSTRSVTNLLRDGLAQAGIDNPESYSSHSYRHGVVKTAIRKGLSNAEIMVITLHRSVRGLRPYIKDENPWRDVPAWSLLDEVITNSTDRERGWRHG